jgi:hypothetical protein
MVKSRPPLAWLVWPAFYVPGVARRAAALHPRLLFFSRLRREESIYSHDLRDGGGEAILIPALKGRAKFIQPLRG